MGLLMYLVESKTLSPILKSNSQRCWSAYCYCHCFAIIILSFAIFNILFQCKRKSLVAGTGVLGLTAKEEGKEYVVHYPIQTVYIQWKFV